MKAIEVSLQTGKPYSSFLTSQERKRPFDIEKIVLNRPREELFERINRRTTQMMEEGLLEEAEALYPYRHLNALNTVGYKELFAYMDGQYDLSTAVELIRRNTRRYAKRQLTWFARDGEMIWKQAEELRRVHLTSSRAAPFKLSFDKISHSALLHSK